ncbi:MAG: aminopeptidase [Bacillota bacterium]
MERKNAWTTYDEKALENLETLNLNYRKFLTKCKTERECVSEVIRLAEENGYENIEMYIKNERKLVSGDKVYHVYMKKSILLYHIGEDDFEKGMNLLGSHIDSPRIDVKQIPLFEEKGNLYFDTHYYGGIRKYQWLSTPLSLHGVIIKKDGTEITISIGETDDEPIFVIADLLPHLSQAYNKKPASEFVRGEKLDLLIGSIPMKNETKEPVKKAVLQLLKEKYDIEEADFISAELEIIPAMHARDCGLDRSMIMGYGQDDRVCAYPSLMALFSMKSPKRTLCCLLVDKEEIGSVGATGMDSILLENSLAEILDLAGAYSGLTLKRMLVNSHMLSCDVTAGFDPMYAECFESKNTAFLGSGLIFNKYKGVRGKSGANDANPEFIAKLRNVMDEANVTWQTSESGAVDVGGGNTISFLMARYGMQVIDSGVAVLGMHSLYEVASKADIYEAYKGFKTFYLTDFHQI